MECVNKGIKDAGGWRAIIHTVIHLYSDLLIKGSVFRVAKQMVGLNKDITATGCVKGVDGRAVVEEEGIMQRWKEYYVQLLNEEFDWNKDSIESIDVMNGEETSVDERLISVLR